MDRVEVASHLFQSFARDPRVLQAMSLHQDRSENIPRDVLSSMLSHTHLLGALDVQQQVRVLRPASNSALYGVQLIMSC